MAQHEPYHNISPKGCRRCRTASSSSKVNLSSTTTGHAQKVLRLGQLLWMPFASSATFCSLASELRDNMLVSVLTTFVSIGHGIATKMHNILYARGIPKRFEKVISLFVYALVSNIVPQS